jgi:sterol 24-C-methyltransferase
MLRMFYLLAFIPYFIFVLFGLKSYFPNTVAGYEGLSIEMRPVI